MITDDLPATDAPRTDLALFEGWVLLAASHLYEALDTAVDELQRDRDFLTDDHGSVNSPITPEERDACIMEAICRFRAYIDADQES